MAAAWKISFCAISKPYHNMPFTYDYPRPLGTADIALVAPSEEGTRILLIRRGREPFAGLHALPGGFMEMEETPLTTATRELQEETGVSGVTLRPLFTCGSPGRDPRGRSLTMVFGALVDAAKMAPKGGDDAAEAEWFFLHALPPMAFDHQRVIAQIVAHLQWQAQTAVIGRGVLPPEFSPLQIDRLHEQILGGRSSESALDRGVRLGLLERAKAPSQWQFAPLADVGPDWAPLVW